MKRKLFNKEAITAEYSTGKYSYRQLGIKHGINYRKIHYLVSNYKGKTQPLKKQVKALDQAVPLPNKLKQLQAVLRKVKLHNEVLEEMVKLSEQLIGIELRKKFGSKRF